MRIVHVTTNDLAGGAARAAFRLHSGLCAAGADSRMYVARRDSGDDAVTAYQPEGSATSRALRRLRGYWLRRAFLAYPGARAPGYEIFTDDRTTDGAAPLAQLPAADVVHLHWIAGLVDYRPFFAKVARSVPLVWTLHDMNPFTGGCHYDRDCGRYRESCGACPQLESEDRADLSHDIWRRKQAAYRGIPKGRLQIVAPSRWLSAAAAESPLLGGLAVRTIPYGLDLREFAPQDRAAARRSLGLKPESKVVLFAADWVGHQRKGFALLAQALAGLTHMPGVQLLSVGKQAPQVNGGVPHRWLGHVASEKQLATIYSAADVFVIPSVQDNLPNTVLESLACGTPVVGFDVGGIPDAVRPGVTGLLAPRGDTRALGEAIQRLLEDGELRATLSVNARRVAEAEYSLELQARRYLALYEEMRKRAAPASAAAEAQR